ncbi:Exopolyphosphatase [Spathaspora sp. JA1]|nr:Exopolyphosphatase [Spathaspora sp. JA1]
MSSIKKYLVQLKQKVDSKSLKTPYRVVTGNQSADMDSVISALSFAYFTNLQTQQDVIPLINIPRKDFRLRRDIEMLLKSHSISEDILYFVEDFAKLSENGKVHLSLVDHNNPQGQELQKAYADSLVEVVSIIDHHADEGEFATANPRIIRSCGSGSCLIFNYFYESYLSKSNMLPTDVIELLLGPLLIDTSNMTQKVEQPDIDAFAVYKQALATEGIKTFAIPSADGADQFDQYYSSLKKAKKDLTGFSFFDILLKDYKQFTFSGKTTQPRVGFSSIGKSLKWVTKNYTPQEIQTTLSNSLKELGIDLFIITSSYTQKKTDIYTREFCYYYETKDIELFQHLDELSKDKLELNQDIYGWKKMKDSIKFLQSSPNSTFKIYNQHNIAASRKQIVPIIKEILEG